MKKLTKKQRKEAIEEIIEYDIAGITKDRELFSLLYNGVEPYKDMKDEEIIEWYEDIERELPKN